MTAVLLRMPSRLSRALTVAGLAVIFGLAGSLTVAMADDPTSDPTVEASPVPAADAEPSSATTATADLVPAATAAPTLPSPKGGGGKPLLAGIPTQVERAGSKTLIAQAVANPPSVLDQVGTVIMAPVQTAVAGHASVAAFFQPRPWLVAVFLGFTIAIVAMLAAGFREKRQLARI
jgi:hypothetical protein